MTDPTNTQMADIVFCSTDKIRKIKKSEEN